MRDIVTLISVGQRSARESGTSQSWRMRDARRLPPAIEGLGPDRAIGGGCHQVSPWMEAIVDERASGEEVLRLTR